jgi:hypothetical protein
MITLIFGLWILLLLLAAIGHMSTSARRQRAILRELERPAAREIEQKTAATEREVPARLAGP